MTQGKTKAVWITRAQPGADRTAEAVSALGFMPVVAPVLSVETLSPALPAVMDGIVFTSRNGVAALARLTSQRDMTALCVGDATAEAAQHKGFKAVLSAGSDALGLRALINAKWSKSRPLLYACPQEPSAPVQEWLKADGFMCDAVAVYRTHAITPDLSFLSADIAAILLHSARAAKQVAACLTTRQIDWPLTFVCISETVDAALRAGYDLPPHTQSLISDFPDEASMLKRLNELRPHP